MGFVSCSVEFVMSRKNLLIYKNHRCPVCALLISVGVHCQKNKAIVCMEHCYNHCEHFKGERCHYDMVAKRKADISEFIRRQQEKKRLAETDKAQTQIIK